MLGRHNVDVMKSKCDILHCASLILRYLQKEQWEEYASCPVIMMQAMP